MTKNTWQLVAPERVNGKRAVRIPLYVAGAQSSGRVCLVLDVCNAHTAAFVWWKQLPLRVSDGFALCVTDQPSVHRRSEGLVQRRNAEV